MGAVWRVGIRTLLTHTGPLCGTIHVSGKLPRQRGARQAERQAETKSRASGAGSDDGSGTTDGGSAKTSHAHSSGRMPDGDSANGGGDEPKRAPVPGKEQYVMPLEVHERELQPLKEMPGTQWAFVKAIDEGVQMVAVGKALLADPDSRVRQRVFEQLVELAYGKNARVTEEERPGKSTWNLPRPERD